ncbi:Ethanolamine-phosphate cytidylyltransferase [Ceratobasidium sp. 392]|nr:Ethanolamine-phosphate cytidylyltransferase [Ceratobasidium sp. 392]
MPEDSPKARLWLDGCFDGFHFAHANAVRQSRQFGDYVIVGVHSDRIIEKNKGPTLFDERERYDLIRGCRWVDEVAEGMCSPTLSGHNDQSPDKKTLSQMCRISPIWTISPNTISVSLCSLSLAQTRVDVCVDYVCHGDDPVLDAQGKDFFIYFMSNDCYEKAKKAGKYKEYPRTDGISTTSIIDRIVLPETRLLAPEEALWKLIDEFATSCTIPPPIVDLSDPNNRHDSIPRDHGRDVVYIGGSWDVFGAAHVELLRRASKVRENTYLIVGVWGEQDVWDDCGERPLLDTLERVLAVLQCRYTSAVIIEAPTEPNPAFLSEISAKFVVNPGERFAMHNDVQDVQVLPVAVPQLQTIAELRERIIDRKDLYSARQKKKRAS